MGEGLGVFIGVTIGDKISSASELDEPPPGAGLKTVKLVIPVAVICPSGRMAARWLLSV